MADDKPRPRLDIRPVSPAPGRGRRNEPPPTPSRPPATSPPQAAPPLPTPEPAAPPEPVEEAVSGPVAVQFRSAGSLLAFLGSLNAVESSQDLRLRANRGRWWLEAGFGWDTVSAIVWTVRGQPFTQRNKEWLPLDSAGRVEPGAPDRKSVV